MNYRIYIHGPWFEVGWERTNILNETVDSSSITVSPYKIRAYVLRCQDKKYLKDGPISRRRYQLRCATTVKTLV
jgi:hypothetical protein